MSAPVGMSTRQLPPSVTCRTISSCAPRKPGSPNTEFSTESALGAISDLTSRAGVTRGTDMRFRLSDDESAIADSAGPHIQFQTVNKLRPNWLNLRLTIRPIVSTCLPREFQRLNPDSFGCIIEK